MQPIVHGIEKEFRSCVELERINAHAESSWSKLLSPVGTPEFVLLDSSLNIIYHWFGFTEKEEFVAVIKPLCGEG